MYRFPGEIPQYEQSEEQEEIPYQLPSDEKNLALFAHLGGFLGILIPLIILIIKRNDSDFVEHHALESLNFQITIIIAWIAVWILAFMTDGRIVCFIFPLLFIAFVVFVIIAAVAAGRGEWYEYPICLRVVH